MKILDASYKIVRLQKEIDVDQISDAYCMCYETPHPTSYEKQCDIIRNHRKHGSPLEHSIMTVDFVINRGISHELVRHRHTGYSQQSTRYCNFSKNKFGNSVSFIKDSRISIDNAALYDLWIRGLQADEDEYFARLNMGQTPEEARGCLPNDLATRLKVSTNFREWHDIFTLRCDTHAHYQMREIMRPLCEEMIRELPCIFDDIHPELDFAVFEDGE